MRKEIIYHVFTDKKDVFTGRRRRAEKTYRRFAREGNARLYREVYRDRENDVMTREDFVKGKGEFPV